MASANEEDVTVPELNCDALKTMPKWIYEHWQGHVTEVDFNRICGIFYHAWVQLAPQQLNLGYEGLFGSVHDGTILDFFTSDHKYMKVIDEVSLNQIKNIQGCPGFVLIRPPKISFLNDVIPYLEEYRDSPFLSSGKLKNRLHCSQLKGPTKRNDEPYWSRTTMPMKPQPDSCAAVTTQGWVPPNDTCPTDIIFDYYIGEIDPVVCFRFMDWPDVASAWEKRERHWPSAEMVQDICSSGCHMIPKHHPGEPWPASIQWRISFSLAELKLMEHLKNEQLDVYMALKRMWNELRKTKAEMEFIKSYHLKTVFFWLLEKTTDQFWSNKTFDLGLQQIIQELHEAIWYGYLPHYFIPQINLFKDIPKETLISLYATICSIKKDTRTTTLKVDIFSGMLETNYALVEISHMRQLFTHFKEVLADKSINITKTEKAFEKVYFLRAAYTVARNAMSLCLFKDHGMLSQEQEDCGEWMLNCLYAALTFIIKKYNTQVDSNLNEDQCEDILMTIMEATFNICVMMLRGRLLLQPEQIRKLSKQNLFPQTFPEWEKFSLPDKNYLTLHQLASEKVWKRLVPYEELVSEAKLDQTVCNGQCLARAADEARQEMLEAGLERTLTFHRVSVGEVCFLCVEGHHIELPYLVVKYLRQSWDFPFKYK